MVVEVMKASQNNSFIYTIQLSRINSDIWSTEDNIKKYESVAADNKLSLGQEKRWTLLSCGLSKT